MQQSPSQDNQIFNSEPTLDNATVIQHGHADSHPPADPGTPRGDLQSAATLSDITGDKDVRDSSADRARSPTQSSANSEHGLNAFAESSRPGSRIFDYESALTPVSRRASDDRLFEIIEGHTDVDPQASPITRLPNELLTHALSHLPAADLHGVALVSRRFHAIVTSPHSWRAAFARFFPGHTRAALSAQPRSGDLVAEDSVSDKRVFTRLATLSTWRSEYILRSQLLRSLQRGKPMQLSPATGRSYAEASRSGTSLITNPIVLYESQCSGLVNHIHGVFEYSSTKQHPRFIHGADDFGLATVSDPQGGLSDKWGILIPPPFIQFVDTHPGDAQWGLGSGEVIGTPNVMDVAQPYGMIYGSGSPGGTVYFRAQSEQRGRLLPRSSGLRGTDIGMPRVDPAQDGVSAVWLAKSFTIPSLSDGLIGIISGHHSGMISTYSLGANDLREVRVKPGELTARWMLCPGVPIVALAVDGNYSLKRQAQNRIWAVALNALGELFFLTKFPKRVSADYLPLRSLEINDPEFDSLAWINGRSVHWTLVEPSRRLARPDPYNEFEVDGSYTPRSSWNGACLSKAQIQAETREIEEFLRKRPKDFQKVCLHWDMRRQLVVDFAADDGNMAGEAIAVVDCGLGDNQVAAIKRFTRIRFDDAVQDAVATEFGIAEDDRTPMVERESLFGPAPSFAIKIRPAINDARRFSTKSYNSVDGSPERFRMVEEWRQSTMSFAGTRNAKVTAVAIDTSKFAALTLSEDPIILKSQSTTTSTASTPIGSPSPQSGGLGAEAEVPGQRACFFAVGTGMGSIFVWDIRTPPSKAADIINTIDPVSVIHTDSPEISCLALTSLQLVHGGNDGLVQAWDPLGSNGNQPLRTLNSRFSSRARRRLAQAQASVQGVGINLFAAGAIMLDPDPTVLRGIVSLGTQLKYWAFSSSTLDQFRGSKRRLRRGERGTNAHGGERLTGTVRNANIKGYIAHERAEMDREKRIREQQKTMMADRFGTDMMTDEEAMIYARMLSEEAALEDAMRRSSASSTPSLGGRSWSMSEGHPEQSAATPLARDQDQLDADLAEAIARSLDESESRGGTPIHDPFTPPLSSSTPYDVPIRFGSFTGSGRRGRRSPRRESPHSTGVGSPLVSATAAEADNDLQFALQLSLAEEESRNGSPSTWSSKGKGKGKDRA